MWVNLTSTLNVKWNFLDSLDFKKNVKNWFQMNILFLQEIKNMHRLSHFPSQFICKQELWNIFPTFMLDNMQLSVWGQIVDENYRMSFKTQFNVQEKSLEYWIFFMKQNSLQKYVYKEAEYIWGKFKHPLVLNKIRFRKELG